MIGVEWLPCGVALITPEVHEDNRGSFSEGWHKSKFTFVRGEFVQDSYITSTGWCFRGLHYQPRKAPMGKLVRVLQGSIIDVVVNVDRDSPRFGEVSMFPIEDDGKLLWVPPHFAHGILSRGPSKVMYKASGFYEESEAIGITPYDPALGLLLSENVVVSERDTKAGLLKDTIGY